MKAIIYSPNKFCPKCNLTKKQLEVEQVHKIASDEDLEIFKDKGYRSFPVVFIEDSKGRVIDEWCDFNGDKLKHYKELNKVNSLDNGTIKQVAFG